MLHDIGEISIPDAILGKPGKLTDEELATTGAALAQSLREVVSGGASVAPSIGEPVTATKFAVPERFGTAAATS